MSNNNIEIEAKVLLSLDDYTKLKEEFKYGKTVEQTNYYIDSEDRVLKENLIALRIRSLGNDFILTMKTPMSEGLLEKNQILESNAAIKMIKDDIFPEGEILDFLELLEIDISSLKILTQLTTDRIEINYKTGLMSLDKNTYGKKGEITDYELECEDSSIASAKGLAKEVLDSLNIKFEFNNKSKQTRAVEAVCCKGKKK